MSFAIYDKDLIMCTGDTLLTYDTKTDEETTISLPKLKSDRDVKAHNNVDMDNYHGITSVIVSPDGNYFSACTNRKQLCLYKRSDRALISNRTLVRAASKARFTNGNDIVVADKSGDAYLFSTKNPEDPGKLILGHLSMLLDVLVIDDDERIVTADRDEKIRISEFPNSYNIVAYCLGHKKFVTCVERFPLDGDVLVSAGGDGEIKFWNYESGRQSSRFSFEDKISKDELDTLNNSLKCFELTESVTTPPVKHLRLASIDDQRCLCVISFYSSKKIFIYEISKDLDAKYLETLIVDEEPLECSLRDGKLWILDENGLKVYDSRNARFKADVETNERLEGLSRSWRYLRHGANKQSLFPILYKRKYDNVQEYQERKKSRLGNS